MRSSLLLLLVLISVGGQAADKPGKRPVEKDISDEKLHQDTVFHRYTPQTEEGKKLYEQIKQGYLHQDRFTRQQIGMMLEYVDQKVATNAKEEDREKVAALGKRCVELWAAKFIQWDDRQKTLRAIENMKSALTGEAVLDKEKLSPSLSGLEILLKSDAKDLKTEYLDILKGSGTKIPEKIKELQNPLVEKMVSTITRELPQKEAEAFNKELNEWNGKVDHLGSILRKYSEKVDPAAFRRGMGIPSEKDIDPLTYIRALLGV